MPDTPQIERQFFILQILSKNHNGYTSEEIRTRLLRTGVEVSKKTVDRDIDNLSMNFGIYEETRNNKTYYMADKININDIAFDMTEMLSLYFLREMLRAYNGIEVGRTARELVEKIISSVPRVNKSYIDTLGDLVKVSLPEVLQEKNMNSDFLNIIQDAIEDSKTVAIKYYSFNKNEVTERRVDPYLLNINEGCYHLIGYCHLRDALRDFRVSRIKDITITDDSFTKPQGFYERYKQDKFDKLSGSQEAEIKIRFQGYSARFVKEYEKRKADKIIENDDGSIIFIRTAAMTDEIERWVLGFGSEAQVLEPEILKTRVKKDIEKMNKIYDEK